MSRSASPLSSVDVNPIKFFKLLRSEYKVSVSYFLVLVNGLPHSGKSEAIENFIKELSPEGVQATKPRHGLSFHELVAVSEQDKTIKYKITTPENCYFHAMQSAMKQRGQGTKLQYTNSEDGSREKIFNNDDFNSHFWDVFAELQDVQGQTTWDKYIFGVAMFNIWDIGYSRTVHHFMSSLHHLLQNRYSLLFFDLERDSKDLFKPPEVQDGENLMKWQSRLHYLVRAAKFSESRLPQRNVCSLFATHDGKLTENEKREKISSIKPKLENAATQIGATEFVNFDNIVSIDPSCSTEQFTANMNDLVTKALQRRMEVPISFIFLRSFYYKNDKVLYAKKIEVKKLANELEISAKKFKEFCDFFTSCGSIIDVSLIDPDSEYIIMKPNLFLKEIDKIFHTTDPVLADTGILTLSAAEKLFNGKINAKACMDILASLSLAVKLVQEQVESTSPLNCRIVFYLPDIRTTSPIEDSSELRPNALRLILGSNASPDHLNVLFVMEFIKFSRNSKVCIKESIPTNVTVMKAFDVIKNDEIEFEVVYFGHTLEFRFMAANEEIFTQIIKCCHKVMTYYKKTKYEFAIMCSKDPIHKREYHYLPNKFLCERCQTDGRLQNSIYKMWNTVVKVSLAYNSIKCYNYLGA